MELEQERHRPGASATPDVTVDVARLAEPAPAPVPLPALATEPAAPSASVLTVGHAEDRAEADADAHADRALAHLASVTGEVHQHGPGCDHVRRSAAVPTGIPLVGHEGGDLDAATSSAIASRRGGGSRMENGVLQRMETAFGSDLSGVRVHTDTTAATLNHAVSARAFTTGQDIFFGAGEYNPGTPGGDKVLAHEVAHTLQNGGGVRRLPTEDDLTNAKGRLKQVPSVPAKQPIKPGTQSAAFLANRTALSGQLALPRAVTRWPDRRCSMDAFLARTKEDLSPYTAAVATGTLATTVARPEITEELLGILKGTFEADWFKAKQGLVFGRWPAGKKATFPAASGLAVMQALTELRTLVHRDVASTVWPRINREEALRSDEAWREGATGAAQEEYAIASLGRQRKAKHFAPGGADTVTSDVDISSGGSNTEQGIAYYNEAFRTAMGLEIDPGTMFDLNVYAKDFIHGEAVAKVGGIQRMTPNEEIQSISLSEGDKAAVADQQDHWALVHIARFMPTEADWNAYRKQVLDEMDPTLREAQGAAYDNAWAAAQKFHEEVREAQATFRKVVDDSLESLHGPDGSQWGADASSGAIDMRAKNHLYEKALLEVKSLRDQVLKLQHQALVSSEPADPKALTDLVMRITEEVSKASLYANEVYGSGAATQHAVIGMQRGKKLAEENKAPTLLVLSPRQWLQAFNDNVGDVLKDYEHYGVHEQDYPYAAFKMGKYTNRVLNALKHLESTNALTETTLRALTDGDQRKKLAKLAERHVSIKDGVAATNPAAMSQAAAAPTPDMSPLQLLKVMMTRRDVDFFRDISSLESLTKYRSDLLALSARVNGGFAPKPATGAAMPKSAGRANHPAATAALSKAASQLAGALGDQSGGPTP